MLTEDENLPEFFKVYIPQHSSEKMEVPNQFMEYLGRRKAGAVRLIGPSGETWVVELVKEGNKMYFRDGWKVFVKDHLLQKNDFLFFEYHGDLQFNVKIYDAGTGCEKILGFSAKCSQGTHHVVIAEDQVVAGRGLSRRQSLKRSNVGCSQIARSHGPSLTRNKEEPQVISSSVKPYFVTQMTRHQVGPSPLIRIPVSFTRGNKLDFKHKEKMVLRVEKSSWIVNIIPHINTYLLSGVKAFIRDNNIKKGNICTFELVDRLEMMVHVSSPNVNINGSLS